MNLFGVLELSGSALTAERQRAEIGASNLANAETTHTDAGGPYRRKLAVFGSGRMQAGVFGQVLSTAQNVFNQGVRVTKVVADNTPPVRRFEPGHPDADPSGYVSYPAINPIEEMLNLTESARAYQLNVAALQVTKAMIVQSLEIAR
jgi:flagellar basal-body rod protein FlgC